MSRLDDRYPDLLEDDRAIARAVSELDAVFAVRPSPYISAAVDRAVYEALAAPRIAIAADSRARRLGRARRPLMVVGGLAAAAALVGGAYAAVDSLGDQGLASGAANETQVIAQQRLGKQVALSQSACGFTMTVERVYADAHGVVVAYTLQGPADHTFSAGLGDDTAAHPPTLEDTQGTGLSSRYDGQAFGVVGAKNAESQILTFGYQTPPAHLPDTIAMRLSLPFVQVVEQTGDVAPQEPSCATYGPPKTVTMVTGQTRTLRTLTVTGPFTFDVTTPVSPTGHIEIRG